MLEIKSWFQQPKQNVTDTILRLALMMMLANLNKTIENSIKLIVCSCSFTQNSFAVFVMEIHSVVSTSKTNQKEIVDTEDTFE